MLLYEKIEKYKDILRKGKGENDSYIGREIEREGYPITERERERKRQHEREQR